MPPLATEEEPTGLTIEEEELGEKGHGGARDSAGTATTAAAAEGPTCCICMEPWTCDDAHRICCIPCGHVYGRSCLERWLHRFGKSSAKWPQCGERFAHKHIINLYAPGNLWDGCCRLQELQARHDSVIAKVEEQEKRMKQLESAFADDSAKLLVLTHVAENAATVLTEFVSMKEQMKKMVEENATLMDLIRLMEDTCTKLRDRISFQPES